MVTQSTPVPEASAARDPKSMHLEAQFDINDIVVFDLGSGRTKVGIAGHDAPCVIFPSVLKEVDAALVDPGDASYVPRVVVGHDATAVNDHRWVSFDRDNLDHVEHVFRNGLRELGEAGFTFGEVHALLTESPGSTLAQRQLAVSRVFQAFQNVKSIAVINSAVLALFSTGRTRGLVIEVGHAHTSAVPVFEGFAIPHATFTTSVAGSALAYKMKELCRYREIDLDVGLGVEEFQAMVERCCSVRLFSSSVSHFVILLFQGFESSQVTNRDQLLCVAEEFGESSGCPAEFGKWLPDLVDEWLLVVHHNDAPSRDIVSVAETVIGKLNQTIDTADDDRQRFELPSGRIVDLSLVGADTAEVLFDSSSDLSVVDVVFSAIAACDHELQMDLIKNVIIVGGTSLLPGLSARLKMELEVRIQRHASENSNRALHPDLIHAETNICADSSRKDAAWVGGSMFGSLSTYSHFAIKRDEFESGSRSEVNLDLAEKAF